MFVPDPKTYTVESVTPGHPDKMCDQISDAILDECLRQDPMSRVAVETLGAHGKLFIAGEVTTKAEVDYEDIARKVYEHIGYTDKLEIITDIVEQSPDIAQGVDPGGAGDQGMMYGYATDETKELMPLPIVLAHKLTRRLALARKSGALPYLRPDGKAQVVVEYKKGRPDRVNTVLVSAQHDAKVSQARLRRDIISHIILKSVPKKLMDRKTKILVNPTGRFVIGGPAGDTGLTGRKIIVDTYGGVGSHGGGAFSGKDPTKVDRTASYAARWAAKNIVAAGLAKKVEVQLSYAIGVARPLSVNVNTYGTGIISDDKLRKLVNKVFDFRPGMLIKKLKLRRPIYRQTASYGHFGRTDVKLPWEETNMVRTLKKNL